MTGAKRNSRSAKETERLLRHQLENAHARREHALEVQAKADQDIDDAERRLRELYQPMEPLTDYDDPYPVVRFKARGNPPFASGRTYSYAALGRRGFWYLTQSGDRIPKMRWQELLEFIGEEHWGTLEVLKAR